MVEDRSDTFVAQLSLGISPGAARREVSDAIDLLVWYAGWCDKYAQVLGNVNPVAGPFFNISTPEPMGVVGIVPESAPALLSLVGALAPVLVSGNTVVVVASSSDPMTAITFSEGLATADVPPGVVNVLTGFTEELAPWLASHMDVNGVDLSGVPSAMVAGLEEDAAQNLKRTWRWSDAGPDLYRIAAFTEVKTVWHPKGR
jgi:acyl-CoA reductase-like NAD-dependent aldehyde dehydrogenase